MPDLKYDALLIDADDTLFDFHKAEEYALEKTFAHHELQISVESVINDFRQINAAVWREYEAGQSTSETIRTKRFVQLFELLGLDHHPGAQPQSVSDRYVHHLSEASFLVDGAMEFLDQLRGQIPMVLLTNGISAVQRPRFAAADIYGYFRDVVISEEVGVQKPDPEVFTIALARVSGSEAISPSRVIMIGDNLHSDIQGALDSGIDACWFNIRARANETGVKPTYTVDTLGEIPSILGL